MNNPQHYTLRPAIAKGIELIDKYYKKAKLSEANIISVCKFATYYNFHYSC